MARNEKERRRNRRRIRIVLIVVGVIVILLLVGAIILRNRISRDYGTASQIDAQTAEVTTGSISTVVSGSGTLSSDDTETTTLPDGVTIDKWYVEAGDTVAEGTLLAMADTDSLLTAMNTVQSEIDSLDDQIAEAEDAAADTTVTTKLAGRVKAIYAAAGDTVSGVMYENGALALLSLDGYLSAEIETDAVAVGDTVTVTDASGNSWSGTVDTAVDGTATILVTDDGTTVGAEVTVTSSDGTALGTGTLQCHEEMKITAYTGTISAVSVSENQKVSADATLFTLSDTGYSGTYKTLLSERTDLEDELKLLIDIYQKGGLYADAAGTIQSLGDSSVVIAKDTTMTVTISVDESDILSLEEGQSANVTISSIGSDAYQGTVTCIDTSATSSSGVTSYTATVTIDKTSDMLTGMSASVNIIIEGVDNALLLPVDAVKRTGSTSYVYTSYDEDTGEFGDMVEVVTGLSNSTYIEIKSGLTEGETVYYTETSDGFDFGSFMGGGDFSGGDFSGGDFSGGDFSGDTSDMPDMSNMPSGGFSGGDSGSTPSMPGGGNGGGGNGGFSGGPSN